MKNMVRTLLVGIVVSAWFTLQAQTFSVLHTFTGGRDGSLPEGVLLEDSAGNLYSTTVNGGNNGCINAGCGTIFRLSATGEETVLHRFVISEGALPSAGLTRDANGNFYGTTAEGGGGACLHGCGEVFKLSASGKLSVLYRFTGGKDGANPYSKLVVDSAGNVYGTTYAGGTRTPCGPVIGCGTAFKVSATGSFQLLHLFSGGADGANPVSGFIRDNSGNLYGTASDGGSHAHGTVFKIQANGNFTVLYSFLGADSGDGAVPYGALVRDSSGNLYGTTMVGGLNNDGTVFKLDPTGSETVLYSFGSQNGDGQEPWAGLVMDASGNFYGTTAFGGSSSNGTVFKLDSLGNETVLHSFNVGTDGSVPLTPLIMDKTGALYGTASEGGTAQVGTVFKLVP